MAIRVKDLPLGAHVRDSNSIWDFKYGTNYTGTTVASEPVQWEIISHDHFGEGKTLLHANNSVTTHVFHEPRANFTAFPWSTRLLRTWLRGVFYEHFSDEFKEVIEECETFTRQGNTSPTTGETVFILSKREYGGTLDNLMNNHGEVIPWFTGFSASFRRRKTRIGETSNRDSWTRSASQVNTNHDNVHFVRSSDGSVEYTYPVNWPCDIVPVVNINGETLVSDMPDEFGVYDMVFAPSGPEPTIREESVTSLVINFTSLITALRERISLVVSSVKNISSTSTLDISRTSESLSQVYPIESEVELASVTAARYTETRAGPVHSSAQVATSRVTVTVTSKVAEVVTHVQRHLQRINNVTTDVISIVTNSVKSAVRGAIPTSSISAIHGDADAYMITASGHKLSNLPLGTVIKDPSARYNGQPIEWIVAAQNHPGAPAGATMLLARHVLSFKAFSAATDGDKHTGTNYGPDRQGYDDWERSDIRKWLNGTSSVPGVHADAVYYNPYPTEPGFLNTLSSRFRESLLTTQVTTKVGGTENVYITEDQFFFLSQTEAGLSDDVAEGTPLPSEVHSLIRYAYPTQEAIDTDDSGASRYVQDPTGWQLRTPNYRLLYNGEERQIRFYATSGDTQGNWYGSVFPNLGSIGVRPAANVDGGIFVEEEPDENGVYTLIYDAIMPEIQRERVTVSSNVNSIDSKALRERKDTFDVSSSIEAIQSVSEPVTERVGARITSTQTSPITQSVVTETMNRVTLTVTSQVTSFESSAVMNKKQLSEAVSRAEAMTNQVAAARQKEAQAVNHMAPITHEADRQVILVATTQTAEMVSTASISKNVVVETVSHAEKLESSTYGELSKLKRVVSSVMAPVTQYVVAEPVKRLTAVVTSRVTEIVSSVATAAERTAEPVSHVDKMDSSVETETFGAKRETFIATTVSNPIISRNSRVIEAIKHSESHVALLKPSVTISTIKAKTVTVDVTSNVTTVVTASTRAAERVTQPVTYQEPLESRSASEAKRETTVQSHIDTLRTYSVTRENDGHSTRTVASQVSSLHSGVVKAHRGALPQVKVSEVETNVKLSVEEARIVLRDTEITVKLTSNFN